MYEELRELKTALEWYEKAVKNLTRFQNRTLSIARKSFNRVQDWLCKKQAEERKLGMTYYQLGITYQNEHKWKLALGKYQQVIYSFKKVGNEPGLGSVYHQIGSAI